MWMWNVPINLSLNIYSPTGSTGLERSGTLGGKGYFEEVDRSGIGLRFSLVPLPVHSLLP